MRECTGKRETKGNTHSLIGALGEKLHTADINTLPRRWLVCEDLQKERNERVCEVERVGKRSRE